MKKHTKQFLLLGVCAVICGALILNWQLGKTKDADTVLDERQAKTEESTEGEKILGKAEFVNASAEYFDSARLNRQESRAEAVGILQGIVDSETASDEEKADARDKLLSISNAADAEGRIENLVKAKGYTECVAIVGDENVNVIVQTAGLQSGDVATIKDIAAGESAKNASDIKIIESK